MFHSTPRWCEVLSWTRSTSETKNLGGRGLNFVKDSFCVKRRSTINMKIKPFQSNFLTLHRLMGSTYCFRLTLETARVAMVLVPSWTATFHECSACCLRGRPVDRNVLLIWVWPEHYSCIDDIILWKVWCVN